MARTRSKHYAVRRGRRTGVFDTWCVCAPRAPLTGRDECRAQVEGFARSEYKAFPTYAEAAAFVRGEAVGPYGASGARAAPPVQRQATLPATVAGAADPDALHVYTDGSSQSNGRLGASAGYGVFWADAKYHAHNIARRLPGEMQTNNRAELRAIIAAVESCPEPERPLVIHTDSQYAISGTCTRLGAR